MRDIWKHGRFVDLWSLDHLLSGFLLGGASYWLELEFTWALVVSLAAMLAWELFEAVIGINEAYGNAVSDLIIGLAGFFLAALVFFQLQLPFAWRIFWICLVLAASLSLWGFLDFLKHGYR